MRPPLRIERRSTVHRLQKRCAAVVAVAAGVRPADQEPAGGACGGWALLHRGRTRPLPSDVLVPAVFHMATRAGGPQAELDIDARLQTAREQFQQRLALIKRDLLLGQAELSQAMPGPESSHVEDRSTLQAGGGDDELTAQVRRVHQTDCRRAQKTHLFTSSAGGTSA